MPSRSNSTDDLLPLASVVIPCLNVAEVLPLQLEALSRQDFSEPWEVIVVDNGSSDDLQSVVERFVGRLASIRVIHEPKRGRQHACNAGVEAAKGEYLIFLDADDEVAPGFLEAMTEALEHTDLVGARLEHRRLNPAWNGGFGQIQTSELMNDLAFLPFVNGCCMGFRRPAFKQVGGFGPDMSFCEDVDISWRAQLRGCTIAFVPDAVVSFRQRSNLKQMFRQHLNYGTGRALLYRDFAAQGMPRRHLRGVLGEWFSIAKSALLVSIKSASRLDSPDEKARLIRRAARALGYVRGSLKYRVFYL